MTLSVNTMVCSDVYFGSSTVIKDAEKCTEVLQLSYDVTNFAFTFAINAFQIFSNLSLINF